MAVTIFENQFPATFIPPTPLWTTYSGGSLHYAGLPSVYLPFWYSGEAVEVAVAGRMNVSGSIGTGTHNPYTNGGAAWYGVGLADPLGLLIPDDSTWAYDLRGTTHEVKCVFSSAAFAEGGFGPILAISKDLFGPDFYFAWYGSGWGAQTGQYEVNYTTYTSYPSSITADFGSIPFDDQVHTVQVQFQPGTVTGDPHSGSAGFSIATDGFIKIAVDGVSVFEVDNIDLIISRQLGSGSNFNQDPVMARSVWLGFDGIIGDATELSIFRGSTQPPVIDNSVPCCHDSVSSGASDGGGTAGNVLGPDTTAPLEPWTPRSAGGGVLPSGIAVTHAEDWRTLFGSTPDIWVEILQKPYPSGSTVTRRVAMQAMAYPTLIEGRVTTAGWGTMEHALSDWRGNPEAGTLAAMVTDTDGMFRGMADTMGRTAYAKADTSLKILSEAGRKSGKVARILQRGVLASAPVPQPGRTAQIQTVDLLGSSWFVDVSASLQSLLITRELLDAAGVTNTPSAVLGKPFPIVVGEHSDHGVETVNGTSAEKGLLPAIDLGDVQLTGSGQVASWAGTAAYAFFTISANVSNGDTVTVGAVTYTFESVFSNTANHVKIGVDALTSKQNLVAAVNSDTGSGTIYGAGTTVNATVSAGIPANLGGGPNTAATVVATYRTVGVIGNGTPVSTTASVGTWFHEGGIVTTDLHGGSDPSVLGVVPPPVLTSAIVGTPGSRTFSYGVCLATAAGQTLISNIETVTTAPDVFDASNYVKLTWAPPAGWDAIYTALAIGFRVCGRTTASPTKTLAITDGAAREYHDGELGGVAHTDVEIDPGPPMTNTATVVTTSDGDPMAVVSGSTTWGLMCVHLSYGTIDDVFGSNLADGATPGRVLLDPTTNPYLLTPASAAWPHPDPWIEIIGPTGQVVRFTGFYTAGPLLAQARAGTVTFAVNGRGPTDDGAATGAPISEAAVGFGWIMNQFALQQNWDARTPWPLVTFADGTQVLDVAALNAFQAYTVGRIGGRGYQMHLYIGDLVTVTQFLAWFNLTFTTYSGPNDDGQYGVWAIDETATPASAPIYRQHIEIDVTLPAPTIATDEVENRLRYHFDWDPDGQAWRGDEETVQDLPSQALYGLRDASTDPSSFLQLQATRDAATARDAMARRLFHNKVAPVYQPIPVSLIGLEAPIGSLVRVTHPDGLGTNGYVARPFFIIRKMLALTAPNQTVTMTARDVYRVYNPDAGTMLDGSGADALPFVMA